MLSILRKRPNLSQPILVRFSSDTSKADKNDSWFSKLLVRRIEPSKESHSRMLSDKEVVYALYTQNVKPNHKDKYLDNYEKIVELVHSKHDLKQKLVGSWSVTVGDLDQVLHLWKYDGGFERIDTAQKILTSDEDYSKLSGRVNDSLRSRHLQYLLAFSYWPLIEPRAGGNIYEIRSYRLKPGTMIEWGNNWARAINFSVKKRQSDEADGQKTINSKDVRNNDEAFAGFFSQIGRLYNVHHVWCYKDYKTRRETRESAWRSPGWDECVAYTVPLIQEMHSRILIPTKFSPTK